MKNKMVSKDFFLSQFPFKVLKVPTEANRSTACNHVEKAYNVEVYVLLNKMFVKDNETLTVFSRG